MSDETSTSLVPPTVVGKVSLLVQAALTLLSFVKKKKKS